MPASAPVAVPPPLSQGTASPDHVDNREIARALEIGRLTTLPEATLHEIATLNTDASPNATPNRRQKRRAKHQSYVPSYMLPTASSKQRCPGYRPTGPRRTASPPPAGPGIIASLAGGRGHSPSVSGSSAEGPEHAKAPKSPRRPPTLELEEPTQLSNGLPHAHGSPSVSPSGSGGFPVRCAAMVGQLVAVGGGWRRLVVGDWWLVAVSCSWRLAVGRRRWQLAAVGGWRLVTVGDWWSLGVVLKGGPQQKRVEKISFLKEPPARDRPPRLLI